MIGNKLIIDNKDSNYCSNRLFTNDSNVININNNYKNNYYDKYKNIHKIINLTNLKYTLKFNSLDENDNLKISNFLLKKDNKSNMSSDIYNYINIISTKREFNKNNKINKNNILDSSINNNNFINKKFNKDLQNINFNNAIINKLKLNTNINKKNKSVINNNNNNNYTYNAFKSNVNINNNNHHHYTFIRHKNNKELSNNNKLSSNKFLFNYNIITDKLK